MKRSLTFISCIAITATAAAQPVLSTGFGYMAAVNGTTYQKTANVGAGNYGSVAASRDGATFYAGTNSKIYYINSSTNAFYDSVSIPNGGDMSAYNDHNTLFKLSPTALYRINTATKTMDSVAIAGTFRLEERPNSKEVWVSNDSNVTVVNYSSSLSTSVIKTSDNQYDDGDVRFTTSGAHAFKTAPSRKKIYKIDANSKTIVDSIDTAPYGFQFAEVSADSSKLFTQSGMKIYVYSVSAKSLIDSITSTAAVMGLYRHPQRNEIWAVHHFADSVSVYSAATHAYIAGIPIGPDPFFLAFAHGTTDVASVAPNKASAMIFPNPATNSVTIRFAKTGNEEFEVYDSALKLLGKYNISTTESTIDVSHLAPGQYFIKHRNETLRFIKN